MNTFPQIAPEMEHKLVVPEDAEIQDRYMNVGAEEARQLIAPDLVDPQHVPLVNVPKIGLLALRGVDNSSERYLAKGHGYTVGANGELMHHKFWVYKRGALHHLADIFRSKITYPVSIESVPLQTVPSTDGTHTSEL